MLIVKPMNVFAIIRPLKNVLQCCSVGKNVLNMLSQLIIKIYKEENPSFARGKVTEIKYSPPECVHLNKHPVYKVSDKQSQPQRWSTNKGSASSHITSHFPKQTI